MEEYPLHSAGRKMVTNVLTAATNETIGSVINRIRRDKSIKSVNYVYIVDRYGHLTGVVSIRDLFSYPERTKLEKIMRRSIIHVSPETNQEKAADLALKHNIKAIPVVKQGILLGVIPFDRISSIINRALQNNVFHFIGIHKAHLEYENTMAVPMVPSILHRLPWLIIGLAGILVAAGIIGIFESILEKNLILAFFIPAIVYMSDALGTQHQTLLVRDMAILGKELNVKAYFVKQMLIAIILGIFIGGIVFIVVSALWKQPYTALVIGVSMFAALVVTGFTALSAALVMDRLGIDPALGSGPFATIVSDLTSVVIYFAVAFYLLG